jgi:hypothetical protein
MVLDCQAVGTTSAENPTNREPNEQGEPDRYATDQSKADFRSCVPLFVEVSIPVVRSPGQRMKSAAATALSRPDTYCSDLPFYRVGTHYSPSY